MEFSEYLQWDRMAAGPVFCATPYIEASTTACQPSVPEDDSWWWQPTNFVLGLTIVLYNSTIGLLAWSCPHPCLGCSKLRPAHPCRCRGMQCTRLLLPAANSIICSVECRGGSATDRYDGTAWVGLHGWDVVRAVRNSNFISVRILFGCWKKTRIRFRYCSYLLLTSLIPEYI